MLIVAYNIFKQKGEFSMLLLKRTSKDTEIVSIYKENARICGTIYTKERLEKMAHLPIGYKTGSRTVDEFGNKYEVVGV